MLVRVSIIRSAKWKAKANVVKCHQSEFQYLAQGSGQISKWGWGLPCAWDRTGYGGGR
jgi:hypothetical protein